MARLGALLAAGALAALPQVAQADSTPSPTAPPEAPLQVVVTQLLPRAPEPHKAIQVTGVVKNLGSGPITNITVRLRLGQVVQFRGDLHDADNDRPLTSPVRSTITRPAVTELAPGASVGFDLRTTTDALDLRSVGAYPLDVEARGDTGSGGTDTLGLAPTWLPYFPDHVNPVRVAVALPVVDEPHQGIDATLLNDDLAGLFAPAGPLGAWVNGALAAATSECGRGAVGPGTRVAPDPAPTRCEPTPVTLAVDPDLLVAASTMTKPYKVKGGTPGVGTANATSWLASVRRAAQAQQVLALPYADPDVTALTRTAGGRDDLALATSLAHTTIADLLTTPTVDTVAWPPAGPVSQSGADALARGGAGAIVLDESAYGQPDTEPNRAPNTRTVFTTTATGSELDGLVADSELSHLVTGSDPLGLGPRLAEQRFLAETVVLAAERPSSFRTLLIAPDRRASASLRALTANLRDLGRVPWLCPVTLTAAARGVEQCAGRPDTSTREPADRGNPRTDTAGQLSPSFLAGIATDRDVIEQLTTAVLSDKQDPAIRDNVAKMKQRLRQAVARAESSAWRADASLGRERASDLHREVNRLRDKIVVRGGRALLTSSKGTLQVSIENTLDVPVDLRVRFTSKTATLSAAETGIVEVTPGHAVQAGVKAQAQRSGQFVVFAQLIDRNGKAFGPEAEIIVRSTRFGRLALAVTAGALGVLFVAAGARIVRRAVRSRR